MPIESMIRWLRLCCPCFPVGGTPLVDKHSSRRLIGTAQFFLNFSLQNNFHTKEHWRFLIIRPRDSFLAQRRLTFLWTFQRSRASFFGMSKGRDSDAPKSEVLQGTLDLMVLKTLHALGPQHGFGIARRIEQLSEKVLQLNEGTVYTSLLRLQQQGWITSGWGTSENNRKAKFYSITKRGLKQLALETENWERISGVIGRVLRLEGEK
jgi:transcriptional regulator